MHPAIVAISLMFVGGSVIYTVADEPRDARIDETASNEQLFRRLGELEQRIAVLESRILGYPVSPKVYPAPYHAAPPVPPRGPVLRAPDAAASPAQDDRRVPESWQRFEFNGQYFYIIPVDQFDRTPIHER